MCIRDRGIGKACQEVRDISHDLQPSSIEDTDISTNINRLVADMLKSNKELNVHVECFPLADIVKLEKSLQLELYRIIQELTHNVVKHAKAQNLSIELIGHENELSLLVEDDGKGMAKNKLKGIGWINIKKRVKDMNGEFKIDSKKNQGTSIFINLPC